MVSDLVYKVLISSIGMVSDLVYNVAISSVGLKLEWSVILFTML